MPLLCKKQKHLINILKKFKGCPPCFTVLLGAGASKSSKVKTASEMITEWRRDYDDIHGEGKARDNHWYGRPEEYSVLFESLYDQPSQRREYIESCLEGSSPSLGYIFLMNLLRKNAFNTVFTTNFDDLLNESCYNFSSEVRPIVCAHDSSVKNIRITTKRPKIIKLHGDFLFDSIKNTSRELETLEANMREKFRQFAPEFGMIVIGYAGNDRSVMDTISSLLRSEGNFPHGIYWCHREGREGEEKKLSCYVDELRRHPNFHTVAIKGFDEFMEDVNDELELSLPDEISDPLNALHKKFNGLLRSTETHEGNLHPAILRTVTTLSEKIQPNEGSNSDDLPEIFDLTLKVPFQFVADIALNVGDYDKAINVLVKSLPRQGMPDLQIIQLSVRCLEKKWDDELANIVEQIVIQFSKRYVECINGLIVVYIVNHKFDAAKKICLSFDFIIKGSKIFNDENAQYFLINYTQVFMHMGETLPNNLRELLKLVYDSTKHSLARMGAAIILGKVADDSQEEYFREAVRILNEDDERAYVIKDWPIFRLLPDELQNNARLFHKKD